MFKVQRFTADDEEEESGGHDSTSILDSILKRAKSRAGSKRARVEPTATTSTSGGSGGGTHEISRVAPGASRRAKARATGEAGFGVVGDGRINSSLLVAEAKKKKHGGVRLLESDSVEAVEHAKGRGKASGVKNTKGRGKGNEDSSSESHESDESDGSDESEDSAEEEEGEEEGMDVDEEDEEEDMEEDEGEEGEEGQEEEEPGAGLEGATQAREAGADGTQDVGGEGLRPMEEVADEWGLDARLADTLREEGVKHFFPIQIRVVPDIVATERHSHVQSRDICVSAPTGSGKTLVFVLGVLQALIRRRVARLRALVLLPSRDLAMQVHAVFDRYARGTGLRAGLAIGQTNFLEEQLALVGPVALTGNPVAEARASLLRGQGRHTGPPPSRDTNLDWGERLPASAPVGGASEVDIVVATPGRLLDHLEKTPGFTLQHLRYLVIDEADRLLNQSYQGWVEKVIKAAHRRAPGIAAPLGSKGTNKNAPRGDYNEGAEPTAGVRGSAPWVPFHRHPPSAVQLDPVTVRGRPLATGDRVRGPTVSTPPLRKLLFSATLTSNPQKLARLDVVNPLIYTAREMASPAAGRRGRGVGGGKDGGGEDDSKRPSQETRRSNLDEVGLDGAGLGRFSTPATLQENYTVCDSQAKPLVLLSLLREMVGRQTELSVVFTSSVDSTHRLFRLLQLFGGFEGGATAKGEGEGTGGDGEADSDGGVAEFSSSLGQRQRSHIVRRARAGGIRVIVCSDGMARGMDLDGVGLVVNYDVPSQPKTYVHRVGRTARAGSRGTAVTIAKKGQVKQFLKMRASVDGKRVRLDSSPAEQSRLLLLAGRYQRCLQDLKEVLEAERTGELDPAAPVTAVDAA